eukprot:gene3600-4482_t
MFVVGFDFGTKNCTIAVARKGGVDVIANEVSNRLTPSMVSFGEKERYLGEPALTNQLRNIRNTITNIKRYIGRDYNDEQVQKELKGENFNAFELPNGYIGYNVNYLNEPMSVNTESVLGMLFGKLKRTTEAFVNAPVKEVVISVPVFWNDYQRRAMLDACAVAGLHCLRLVNETTATALSYGIYKEFSETEATNTLFIDVGDAATTVAAVAYKKGQLQVLKTAFDPNIGGRTFDDTLVRHFAKEFQTKYKINIYENKKALTRVQVACEKVKKILSSNNEAPISIDSLMEDIDVKGMIDRKTFEELIVDDLEKILVPLKKVIEETGLTPDKFASIEITGGGTRSTSVQKKLIEFLGRELSKTINSEESVCRGCALQSAMLSPVFRVRPFLINDIATYPIAVDFQSESINQHLDVFTTKSPVASPKPLRISFPVTKAEPFKIVATSTYGVVTTLTVDKVPEFANKASIKAKVYLDIHGIFHIEELRLVEQIEEPVVASPPAEPKPEEQQSQDSSAANGEAKPAEPKPEEKKVKVKETPLVYTEVKKGLTTKEVEACIEQEGKMHASDTLAAETGEKKNAVESYTYEMRSKLQSSLQPYATPKEVETLMKLLNDTENWLYEEGSDATKSVYQAKLDELTAIGGPIQKRKLDRDEYQDYATELKNVASHYKNEAMTPSEKYEHIPREDKEKIIAECDQAVEWIDSLIAKDKSLPLTSNCPVSIPEIKSRKQKLEHESKLVLNKPKPAPPKVETPPPQPQTPPTNNTTDEKMNEPSKEDEKMTEPAKEDQKMDEMD